MNILYGVQATGNGHINRSREIVKELKDRGHNVRTIFSGREKGFFDIQDFRPYKILKGLTFKTKNGKIDYWKTLTNLDIRRFNDDIKSLCNSLSGYHIVISDFEPLTTRYAKRKDILSIGLSHQASFYGKVPVNYYDPIAIYITRNFAKCDLNIGVHWDTFGNDHIIPPIIPELTDRTIKDKYLVYLPFENNDYIEVLNKFKQKFYVYTPNKFESTDNVTYMPFSRTTFLNDLEECEGVICNAGFELISEAVSIGKKVLVKPVKKQYEQHSNAKCIVELGLGKSTKKMNEKAIEDFIFNCTAIEMEYPNTAKLFVDWLEGKTFNVKQLAEKCWKENK